MTSAQQVSMKKKRFEIAQKLIQTDYYVVEAETAEEALRLYTSSPGILHSQGSCGGWPYDDNEYIVVTESSPAENNEKIGEG